MGKKIEGANVLGFAKAAFVSLEIAMRGTRAAVGRGEPDLVDATAERTFTLSKPVEPPRYEAGPGVRVTPLGRIHLVKD